MDPLTAARAQMEVSLGFHMVFAALGIGMPLLMVIAEGLWLRTGRAHYRDLARKWAKATALLFAIGAVSGTALSFELGLLWPRFMEFAGPLVGPAFAVEGVAFFIEAIFIGLYLYGWDRLSPRAHWLTGVPVAVSGAVSGIVVLAVNAFMQHPVGFTLAGQRAENVDPGAVFANPAWFHMALHSTLSCYVATGFAVAGVYAAGLLRGRRDDYHRAGLAIALGVGALTAVLQPLSGDLSARSVARYQPEKLAAMEALFHTERGPGLLVGGIPDPATGEVRYGVRIPRGLSLLTTHTTDATIRGLESFPADERPNAVVTHLAFQVMVGAGFALMALGATYWVVRWRQRRRARAVAGGGGGGEGGEGGEGAGERALPRWLLRAVVLGSPLGFLALEAGWIVTEVGRQPWVIYRVMRTRDAVTPREDVVVAFVTFTALYVFLGVALAVLLRRLATGREPAAAEARDGAH